jgi:uncharacterized protein (TIGR00730 family)
MSSLQRVCIFCASSPEIDSVYFDAAGRLARILVENNIAVNYGGGGKGLMGHLADNILAGGGSIRGYIPAFMKEMEWQHGKVDSMVTVRDMHERKYLMRKDSDAIIALPGGVGTLEELMEVITLKQLGKYLKPIIIINTAGFYTPLIGLMQRMIDMKFMRDIHIDLWQVVSEPEEVMEAIKNAPVWDAGAIKFAAVGRH